MNTRGELASSRPAHPALEAERQVDNSQSRKRAISAPEMASSTKLSRLLVANQVFLGSWTVDIRQKGINQRSAPQKRHRAHLRQCSHCTPRKLSGWDGGGDKMPCTWGVCAHQTPGHLSCLDLGRAQITGPAESVPLWSTQEPEPEQLRTGKCMQPRAPFRQFPCRAT